MNTLYMQEVIICLRNTHNERGEMIEMEAGSSNDISDRWNKLQNTTTEASVCN